MSTKDNESSISYYYQTVIFNSYSFFGSESSSIFNPEISGVIPADGTRFLPAFLAGRRAQTIPSSGLFEKLFLRLESSGTGVVDLLCLKSVSVKVKFYIKVIVFI